MRVRGAAQRIVRLTLIVAAMGCGDLFGTSDSIHFPEELDGPRLIVTALDQNGEGVGGVRYNLIEPGGANLGPAISDDQGRAVYMPFGILAGTYNLVIDAPPEGYRIADGQPNPVTFEWRSGTAGEIVTDRSLTVLLLRD